MQALGKEETCIIGVFGLLPPLLKTTNTRLEGLIANLERNLCLFGAPSYNSQMN